MGVLALYRQTPFSDENRNLLEQIARPLSERLDPRLRRTSAERDVGIGDRGTSLCALGSVSSLLCIEILNWTDIERRSGGGQAQELMGELALRIKDSLGSSDVLVRIRDNEFLALLSRTEAKDVRALSRHLRRVVEGLNQARVGEDRLDVAVDAILSVADSAAILELLPADFATVAQPYLRSSAGQVH